MAVIASVELFYTSKNCDFGVAVICDAISKDHKITYGTICLHSINNVKCFWDHDFS